jgi:hypothetical protein
LAGARKPRSAMKSPDARHVPGWYGASRNLRVVPRRASSMPVLARELTGASELFSSWLSTRMRFLPDGHFLTREFTGQGLISSSRCARPRSFTCCRAT